MNPLPVEIIERILKHCDNEGLKKYRWVCRTWFKMGDPLLQRQRYSLVTCNRVTPGQPGSGFYEINAIVDALNLGEAVSAFTIEGRYEMGDPLFEDLWRQYIRVISIDGMSALDRKISVHRNNYDDNIDESQLEWLQAHPREFTKRLIEMYPIQLPYNTYSVFIITGVMDSDFLREVTYPTITLPYLSWMKYPGI